MRLGSAIFFAALGCCAADYYLDSNAAGGGDGSVGTPWNTIALVSGLTTGDNLYIARNSVLTGKLTVSWSGSSTSSPSIIAPYGSGDAPELVGLDNTINASAAVSNILIHGLLLNGATSSVIRVRGLNPYWTVSNCTIQASQTAHGLSLDALHFRLLNCIVRSNGSSGSDHGIYVDTTGTATDVELDGNQFTDNYGSGVKINSGELARIVNVRVTRNLISGNGDKGIDDAACEECTFASNVIDSNGATYDGNAIVMTSNTGTFESRSNLVANNTILHSRPGIAAIRTAWGSGSHRIVNNLFSLSSTAFYMDSTNASAWAESDNNLFYGGTTKWALGGTNYTTLATWQSGSGLDAASLTNNPVLTGYIPGTESPAIGSGQTLTEYVLDYTGATRVAPWDIGAYEYFAPSAPTVTANSATVGTIQAQ